MAKHITTHNDRALTIDQRIAAIRSEREEATLTARREFDERLLVAVKARVSEVLERIVG